jgi:hypothetical protein
MERDRRLVCEAALQRRGWALTLALLLLGGAACSTPGTRSGPRLYSEARHGIDRFVQAQGYRLHYVEGGQEPPVVLIPGAFTTYRTWDGMLLALAAHHRVLLVDYVGVGDSD